MDYCKRYDGRNLGDKPHIVVMGSCKVGNFIVTLPLLNALRREYPKSKIDFWGSENTKELEEAFCVNKEANKPSLINWRTSWDNEDDNKFLYLAQQAKDRGKPTILINCDGFNPITQVLASWLRPEWIAGASLDKSGRKQLDWGEKAEQRFLYEKDWETKEFMERYKHIIKDQYIGNLMCLMAFIKPKKEDFDLRLPAIETNIKVPEILIHCTTTRRAKMWSRKKWRKIIDWCKKNQKSVGMIGAAPEKQKIEYNSGNDEEYLLSNYKNAYLESGEAVLTDLRGRTTLTELIGVCQQAKAVISVDAGPLHIAAASGTAVLAIVGNDHEGIGASPINLWLPRSNNVTRTISGITCRMCLENRFKNDECLKDSHECMENVSDKDIVMWMENIE